MSSTQHVPAVVQALAPIVDRYGYLAVGGLIMLEDFGVPSPGETVLIAAAFYAGLGQLSLPAVIVVGTIGAIIGDNIGFAIGQYGGHPLVLSFGRYVFVTPQRLHKLEAFFERRGPLVVVIARFIEGLRQLNGIIAGLSEMRWPVFLVFNSIGALLWTSCWALVGYFGGSHIDAFLKYQLYVTVVVAVGLAAYIAYRIIKRPRRT